MTKFVTVKVFDTAIDAHIYRNMLENEGIECHIFDENIVTINPLFNFAVGGIKLKVLTEDREKAEQIITEFVNQPMTDDNENIISCPKCQSTDFYTDFKSMKGTAGIISAITSFVFSAFPIYFKSVYKCKNCDHEFKIGKV